VRVHDDAAAQRSARAVDAHAYTVGAHVVFASGQFAPSQSAGRHLLAHELSHVVQQGHGLGAATPLQRKGPETIPLGVTAPFVGRVLSSRELTADAQRSKAYLFTGQIEAKVCDVPDPRKAQRCAPLSAGSTVRVVRVVSMPRLEKVSERWVEGGAGWYEVEHPDDPRKTGFLLGVFVALPEKAPEPEQDKDDDKSDESPFHLPEPEKPTEPPGPKRSAPQAVETFCKPFKSKATAMKAHATNKKILMDFTSRFGSDVQDLWRTYMDTPKSGTKGTLPARRIFADQKSRVVNEFRTDPETVKQRDAIFDKISSHLKSDNSLVPAFPGQSTNFIPFRKVLKDEDLLNLPMSFKDPTKRIPGLIAGGFGKTSSDAGDDVRNVDGQFAITNVGGTDIRIRVLYVFDVHDAIDFCPGAPGTLKAQLGLTDDLSRLEATPDVPTYDTPFEVVVGTSKDEFATF
jgi:hypothetical protein